MLTIYYLIYRKIIFNYLRSDSINILDTLEIQQLLTLLKYLANPGDSTLLFHVLSFNFINFQSF